MIELISDSRCTGCNICVRVCPVNVFDIVEGAAPVIARQDACQTCFMRSLVPRRRHVRLAACGRTGAGR